MDRRDKYFKLVEEERLRQETRWGGDQHDDDLQSYQWQEILFRKVTDANLSFYWPARRRELIQVMAVALAWIESIDRKDDSWPRE